MGDNVGLQSSTHTWCILVHLEIPGATEVRPLESFDPPPRPLRFLLEESMVGVAEWLHRLRPVEHRQ